MNKTSMLLNKKKQVNNKMGGQNQDSKNSEKINFFFQNIPYCNFFLSFIIFISDMNEHFIPQAKYQYVPYHSKNYSQQLNKSVNLQSSRAIDQNGYQIVMPTIQYLKIQANSRHNLGPKNRQTVHFTTEMSVKLNTSTNQAKEEDPMSVSFGRRYVDQFNLPSNQPKSPQSDSIIIRTQSPIDNLNLKIKTILSESIIKDDSSNEGDQKHHYRVIKDQVKANSERKSQLKNSLCIVKTTEKSFKMEPTIQINQIKDENNPEDDDKISTHYSNTSEIKRNFENTLQQTYKQVFFIIHYEKWVKIEVDLKSYPRSWTCKQLSEILAQLYAEEESKILNYKTSTYCLRFFQYNSKTSQEDVIDINQQETLSKVCEFLDFNFNLDYFWLKITE